MAILHRSDTIFVSLIPGVCTTMHQFTSSDEGLLERNFSFEGDVLINTCARSRPPKGCMALCSDDNQEHLVFEISARVTRTYVHPIEKRSCFWVRKEFRDKFQFYRSKQGDSVHFPSIIRIGALALSFTVCAHFFGFTAFYSFHFAVPPFPTSSYS